MSADRTAEIQYEVMNNILDAVIIVDTCGRILFINRAAVQLQNVCRPTLKVGGMILDSVRRQWKEIVKNVIGDMLSSKRPSNFENDYPIDGRKTYFDICTSPILDASGSVHQIIIQIRDITLQKIYENKIREVAGDLSRLVATAHAAIIGLDTRGYIVEWNDFTAEITGYSKADALAKHFSDLLLDRNNQATFSRIIEEGISGKVITSCELKILSKEQKILNLLINASLRKNQDMKVIGIIIIGQDITELSTYRNSLEQKVRDRTDALRVALDKERELVEVKNKFISIASHEFKFPISVIKFQVEGLKKLMNTFDQADIIARLSRIHDQADHMSILLEDILLIDQADAGKISVNVETIELKSVLDNIIADVEQTTNKSHHIHLTFPGNSLSINTDKNILRNILINLLSNAVKFSPNSNRVHFEVACHGMLIEFTISDEGIGISADEICKIFEPFNRASNAKCISGTGLGLSIVKKAVATLDGRLWVESKLNKGTKFTVQLKTKPGTHDI